MEETSVANANPTHPAPSRDSPRPTAWLPATVFALLALAIGGIGRVAHGQLETDAKSDVQMTLQAVTSLKIERILAWRAAVNRDALALAGDPALRRAAQRWHGARGLDSTDRRAAATRLEAIGRSHPFTAAALLGATGAPFLSSRGLGDLPRMRLEEAPADGSPLWIDIPAPHTGDPPTLAVVVPLVSPTDPARVIGALHLRTDAEHQLHPIVRDWPTPSGSAETLLFRAEGGRVAYLHPLRHPARGKPSDGWSIAHPTLLAAQVLRGYEGVLQGADYRGVPVVGYGRRIEGSPWFLLSKVDADEIYAPLARKSRLLVAAALSAVGLSGIAFLFWWRHQRTLIALDRLSEAQARRTLERRYADLTRISNDVILLTDEGDTIVEINERAERLYGRSPAALVGLPLRDLCHPDAVPRHDHDWQHADTEGGLIESVHRRHDGTPFPVEISVRTLDVDGRRYHQAVVRDISERRRLEDRMHLYSLVFDTTSEAVLITDAEQRIVAVNPAFIDITGYTQDEVLGRTPRLLSSGRQDASFYARMWACLSGTGRWQGEIWNRRKDGHIYPEWQSISAVRDAAGRVTHYVAIFSDISERKATEERMRHLAQHDPLTNLPNRVLMQDRLQQALSAADRTGARVALMVIDLDRFKNVNDSLGHTAGDELLRGVAKRLQAALRQGDTVCRLGGDEFVVIIPAVWSPGEVATLAERLLSTLAGTFQLCGHNLQVTPSIGVSVFPDDGTDIDTLMRNADTAMYQAKEMGRNGYRFFTPDMNQRVLERLTMEADMRAALTGREFRLHYQPQIDLKTGRLIGLEALVRWRSPRLGDVPAARFIAVAEESGLIIPLGEQILRMACEQRRRWLGQGLAHFPVSVNVSPIQFRDTRFDRTVARVLEETGLPANLLDLELTESAVMHQGDETVQMLRRLKALGVTLSIDDFGTGYSSLAYLKRFPIDRLKIDQSFVRDVLSDANDLAIVRVIIALGQSLKVRVIAEGVETDAQFALLRDSGCDECQGYLIGRPVPPEQAIAWHVPDLSRPRMAGPPRNGPSRPIALIAYSGHR